MVVGFFYFTQEVILYEHQTNQNQRVGGCICEGMAWKFRMADSVFFLRIDGMLNCGVKLFLIRKLTQQ